jgi:hypothetical protein
MISFLERLKEAKKGASMSKIPVLRTGLVSWLASLEGGSPYEGRQIAVTHLTGAQYKVPIPVNPYEYIYAFPTHSPQLFQCYLNFIITSTLFTPNRRPHGNPSLPLNTKTPHCVILNLWTIQVLSI